MWRREKGEVFSVTSAPENPNADYDDRSKRYIIAMSIRLACFAGIWVVHGWLRWTMAALMIVLPYIAVVIANTGQDTPRKSTPGPLIINDQPAIEGRTDALGPGSK